MLDVFEHQKAAKMGFGFAKLELDGLAVGPGKAEGSFGLLSILKAMEAYF